MLYTISVHYLELAIFSILTVIDLHRGVEFVVTFLKNFKNGGEEHRNS